MGTFSCKEKYPIIPATTKMLFEECCQDWEFHPSIKILSTDSQSIADLSKVIIYDLKNRDSLSLSEYLLDTIYFSKTTFLSANGNNDSTFQKRFSEKLDEKTFWKQKFPLLANHSYFNNLSGNQLKLNVSIAVAKEAVYNLESPLVFYVARFYKLKDDPRFIFKLSFLKIKDSFFLASIETDQDDNSFKGVNSMQQ